MIFHTAAEKKYYNAFFKNWHSNILKHVPSAKFSLKFVGDADDTDVIEFCDSNNISLILDPISLDSLLHIHGTYFKASGYYTMARWNSIPVIDDHVCVTDVDVIMLRNETTHVENLLQDNDFVGLSRGGKCKLMVNFINKDYCLTVKDFSINLMDNPKFCWSIDMEIGKWMEKNMKHEFLPLLTKFDFNSNRTGFDIAPNSFFGYYSSVSFSHNGQTYEGGFEAKSQKYEIAKKNKLI